MASGAVASNAVGGVTTEPAAEPLSNGVATVPEAVSSGIGRISGPEPNSTCDSQTGVAGDNMPANCTSKAQDAHPNNCDEPSNLSPHGPSDCTSKAQDAHPNSCDEPSNLSPHGPSDCTSKAQDAHPNSCDDPSNLTQSSRTPAHCYAARRDGPITILVSNGGGERDMTPVNAEVASHQRATSCASIHGSFQPSSSSSSFSNELSHNSSFNSRELLEQLVVDLHSTSLCGEALEKNEAVQQLLEHIISLKLELEELRQENQRLKQVQSAMDDELHTLTENLFEEAYKMVDTAKEEKGLAVKKLADAAGKIDAMETEVSALKSVLHATPTTLKADKDSTSSLSASPHNKHRKPNVKKAIRKLSRKVKLSSKSSVNSAQSAIPHTLLEHRNEVKGACLIEGQVDSSEFSVFNEWLANVDCGDHPYLLKVMEQDVLPCLNFSNKQLSAQVLTAVRNNDLYMESLSAGISRECVLSGCDEICCSHRMQLAPSQPWQYISQHCRDRIAAVCDFYMYMGHVQKGILKLEPTQLYWQLNRLRAQMNLARLTLLLPD